MPSPSEERGALPAYVRTLATLGCALALRREDQIAPLAIECSKASATPDQVREVLGMAIVMSECPGEQYRMDLSPYWVHLTCEFSTPLDLSPYWVHLTCEFSTFLDYVT